MRIGTFLLCISMCLGIIKGYSKERIAKFFNTEMPFDQLISFYVNIDWIRLQLENASSSRFGALQDENADIVIDKTRNFIVFNRMGFDGPAVLSGRNVTLSNCENIAIFYGNGAKVPGCAILAQSNIHIIDNDVPCLFINNYSFATAQVPGQDIRFGSCVYAKDTVFIEGNRGLLLFKNNHVDGLNRNGGAVGFGNDCYIRNNGPIVFENNRAEWGGAICTPTKTSSGRSSLHIFANRGNIVFNNNTDQALRRNALLCQEYHDLQLGATEHYSVSFFDPIDAQHITSHPVRINPNEDHLGTVLFSGATLQGNSPFSSNSLHTRLKNTTEVYNGTLAIEDKAVLYVAKLTTQGGTVRLGHHGTLATDENASNPNTNTPVITITSLALNLPSLLKKDAIPPRIWLHPKWVNNNPTYTEHPNTRITISGDLILCNSQNEDPYDSADLSEEKSRVPLLYLSEGATNKVDIQDLNIAAINDTEHYGYQGVWATSWEEYTSVQNTSSTNETNTCHRILFGQWAPSGYIPNPKNRTNLVPHTLWNSVHVLQTYMQNSPSQFSAFQLRGQATRMLYQQNDKDEQRGFHTSSKGYWVEIASSSLSDHQLALQFGQNFTHTDENASENNFASKHVTAALRFSSAWCHDLLETSAKCIYTFSDHHIHHSVSQELAISKGMFFATTLGTSLFASIPMHITQLGALVTPFVEVKGVHSRLSAFKELGTPQRILRSFRTDRPLIVLTTPVGVSVQPTFFPKHMLWSASVAYQPTVVRQKPKVRTTLMISNGSWIDSGMDMDRQAIVTRASISLLPFSWFRVQAEYEGTFSSSATCNHVACGGSICF